MTGLQNCRRAMFAAAGGDAAAAVAGLPRARGGFRSGQDLAGVQDAVRVEGGLDAAHGVELCLAAPVRHHAGLEAADAVFGREAAVEAAHHRVHRIHDRVVLGEEPGGVGVLRLFQVEMNIAVAEMAERHGATCCLLGLMTLARVTERLQRVAAWVDSGQAQFAVWLYIFSGPAGASPRVRQRLVPFAFRRRHDGVLDTGLLVFSSVAPVMVMVQNDPLLR